MRGIGLLVSRGICGGGLFANAKPARVGRGVLAGQRQIFGNIWGGIKPGCCHTDVCAGCQGKGKKTTRKYFEHDAYDITANGRSVTWCDTCWYFRWLTDAPASKQGNLPQG